MKRHKNKIERSGNNFRGLMETSRQLDEERNALTRSAVSVVGGEFYAGIEWMAAWMLDNVEGEQVDELTLRQWAVNAWLLHLESQNAKESHAGERSEPELRPSTCSDLGFLKHVGEPIVYVTERTIGFFLLPNTKMPEWMKFTLEAMSRGTKSVSDDPSLGQPQKRSLDGDE